MRSFSLVLCLASQLLLRTANAKRDFRSGLYPEDSTRTFREIYNPPPNTRLIFISDPHGCIDELNLLLKSPDLNYNPENGDVVLFAGDLVAKGKDSQAVIDRAIELKAKCVRGNHDEKVVRWKNWLENNPNGVENLEPNEEVEEDLEVGSEHEKLARELSEDAIQYLRACPIILTIPEYNIHLVHGGLDPYKDIDAQEPRVVMNLRSIADDGSLSRINLEPKDSPKNGRKKAPKNGRKKAHKNPHGQPWADVYNKVQAQKKYPWSVVYGHDAKRGVKIKDYTYGLDGDVVAGKELVAYVFPEKKLFTQKALTKKDNENAVTLGL